MAAAQTAKVHKFSEPPKPLSAHSTLLVRLLCAELSVRHAAQLERTVLAKWRRSGVPDWGKRPAEVKCEQEQARPLWEAAGRS